MKTPNVTRHYLNHHLDSSRWDIFKPRQNDIVVTTSYKCGTTFTQQILYNLLVRNTFDDEVFPELGMVAPWVDARFIPLSKPQMNELIEALTGRRFLKSHLPLDGLPYFPQVKYIVVARDPRDVFMSLLNHYGAYTDFMYGLLDNLEGSQPMPRYNGDIKELWKNWISQGWFEWEQEGYPFWSNMHHTQSYWDYKSMPNFLFLHYSDMIRDTHETIRRIAAFIDLPVSENEISLAARAVSFKRIKEQAVAESAKASEVPEAFAGGQETFINKGTNGRWNDLLDDDDIKRYEETRDRVLSPDCASWIENGGIVSR
ncbi:MAG: aryl sulfotransferase [Candidatus Azotimanducaceae bacterium]|jgi:aryl sulfotransferase